MKLNPISRRNFIKVTTVGAGGLCLSGCYTSDHSPYLVLTMEEARILDALADQIIPPDEFAGGKQAGITNFIDRQLACYYKKHTSLYKICLPALNKTCSDVHGEAFTELQFDMQYEYLKAIQTGKYNSYDWGGYNPSSFFGTLRNHCMQGYYGSPRHGGNRDYVSYQMLGLDYPHIIGRNSY